MNQYQLLLTSIPGPRSLAPGKKQVTIGSSDNYIKCVEDPGAWALIDGDGVIWWWTSKGFIVMVTGG